MTVQCQISESDVAKIPESAQDLVETHFGKAQGQQLEILGFARYNPSLGMFRMFDPAVHGAVATGQRVPLPEPLLRSLAQQTYHGGRWIVTRTREGRIFPIPVSSITS